MTVAAEQLRLPLADRLGDLGFGDVRWAWPRKPDVGNGAAVTNRRRRPAGRGRHG